MDRDSESSESAPAFNVLRAAIIAVVAIAIIVIGSWIVRTHPNPGYQAGYEATIAKGAEWIRAEVRAPEASGTTVCDVVYKEVDESALEPLYDHATFIRGCADAVDHVMSSR